MCGHVDFAPFDTIKVGGNIDLYANEDGGMVVDLQGSGEGEARDIVEGGGGHGFVKEGSDCTTMYNAGGTLFEFVEGVGGGEGVFVSGCEADAEAILPITADEV